jgi:hypothetical protein
MSERPAEATQEKINRSIRRIFSKVKSVISEDFPGAHNDRRELLKMLATI